MAAAAAIARFEEEEKKESGEGKSTEEYVPGKYSKVVVHPIVLLSAVDHYNRVAKDTKKRVVGILLGETNKGVVDATASYALPFEEDERDLKALAPAPSKTRRGRRHAHF